MLKKRIIPCLDIKDGRTVKGVNFVGLRDAGDPVELAKQYAAQGADELCFLDITATIEKRETLVPLVREIAAVLNIPFTVGGGINDVLLAKEIIKAGADKIAVNSAAVKTPELINALARELGSQCVVVAVDTKAFPQRLSAGGEVYNPSTSPLGKIEGGFTHKVYIGGGRFETDKETIAWCTECEERGAGEILLTSMDHDGTKNGFALGIIDTLSRKLTIPIIASGGGGTAAHFEKVIQRNRGQCWTGGQYISFW